MICLDCPSMLMLFRCEYYGFSGILGVNRRGVCPRVSKTVATVGHKRMGQQKSKKKTRPK